MVTWFEHPQHGRHPATGEEIDALKSAGWKPCPSYGSIAPVIEEAPVIVAPTVSPQEPQKRAPGRPPKNAGDVGYGVSTIPD